MNMIARLLGNVRMTTTILVLVMLSIIGSIAAVSGVIYMNLYSQAMADGEVQQQTNLGVAATILERRISGSVLTWTEEGEIATFQSWAIPPFYDTEVIDSVTRVTRQDAAIYVIDTATGDMVAKTTSIALADGTRGVGGILPAGSDVVARLMAGERVLGQITIDGTSYKTALQPIQKTNGDVMGAIFVGTPMANVEAAATSVLGLIAIVGGAAVIGFGLIGFIASRLITRPIPKLAQTMDVVAQGNYDVEVPFTTLGNEVGAMARAVEVFRENGLRVSQMTEAEAARIVADEEKRRLMMTELQAAFGEVVDAAVAWQVRACNAPNSDVRLKTRESQ